MRWSWRAFRVGAAGAVDSDAFNSSPARSPTPQTCSARLHVPARPLPTQKTAGTPKGAASAMDATPFRWILAQRARFLAGDYGRRYPEGMLGVASALPGTRTFTA